MKILNLYCGGGGNRLLWGDNHDVTAVEIDPKVAIVYQTLFPRDRVIVDDAHEFLLKNFNEFDFIWASPSCTSHSKMRFALKNISVVYPNMELYQEIILLQNFHKGLFCVENVMPYYKPLIAPTTTLDRHFFWSNFRITSFCSTKTTNKPFVYMNAAELRKLHDIEIDLNLGSDNNRKILRNMVNPSLGKHILDCALSKHISKHIAKNVKQNTLFDSDFI